MPQCQSKSRNRMGPDAKPRRCKRNAWAGSKKWCYQHDPANAGKLKGPKPPWAKLGPDREADATKGEVLSLHGAKLRVSKLLSRAEATGMRPRDQAELLRVLATLSELEQKQSAEGIEGLVILDMPPGSRAVVLEQDGTVVVDGKRMKLVPA